MARFRSFSKKRIKKIFFSYGVHLWLLLFLMNVAIFYVARFYSMGQTCFTPAQVSSDNRCLYILNGKVYEKGSRNSPHQGHSCGSDVTSVLPPSHMADQATYLLPNYVGDICTAQPTATPVPPTNTPIPTATPINTPTPTHQPTSTTTPVPTITQKPTDTPIPIQTSTKTQPTNTPIVTRIYSISLTPTPTVTLSQRTLTPQVTVQPTATSAFLLGDLNSDNMINAQDYNLLIDCYGNKVTSSSCTVPQAADLNNDGLVDGIDYNMMLRGIQSLIGKEGSSTIVQPTGTPQRKQANKQLSVTPTPSSPAKNAIGMLFAAANVVLFSKVLSIVSFIVLIGIGILGAYRGRLMRSLFHRKALPKEHPTSSSPTEQSTSSTVPVGKAGVTGLYYVTKLSDAVVNGQYKVSLADNKGRYTGYLKQNPPPNGYYSVVGYKEEVDKAPGIIITSLTPVKSTT